MPKLLARISEAFVDAALAAQGNRGGAALIASSAAFAASLTNRYEAAQPTSPKRSYIPAFNRDARYDANSYSRWEMTRKIRYFERNCWAVQAFRDEHVKWTVGANGLAVIPNSSDDEWNLRTLEAYQEWCLCPCIDSTIGMRQVHKQIAGTHHLENDLFILKTYQKLQGKKSLPKIQLIESHRCSDPGTDYAFPTQNNLNIDGVSTIQNGDGMVQGIKGYWFIDNLTMDQWVFRSVSDVIHIFEPERIGMFRGVTPYHSILNTLHDVDDMELYEMERAKSNSAITNILTTQTGEINTDAMRERRFTGLGSTGINPDVKDDNQASRTAFYRKMLGSRTMALKAGEKLEQFGAESPSASTQWYWLYQLAKMGKVAGTPVILILPEIIQGMQGTVVRGIYDDAHQTFTGKFHVYKDAAVDLYRYFVNWARYNDPRCVDAPADWAKCHVTPPRAVNADIGYTSAATLAELGAGVDNWDDIAGRKNTTARDLLTKKARGVKMINDLAAEFKIQPADISNPMAMVSQQLALADQAQALADQAGDDKGTNPPKEKAVKK